MGAEVYRKVSQALKSGQKRRKIRNGAVPRKVSFGRILGIFAASFTFTFLVVNLVSRLATQRGTNDRSRAAPLEIPSINRDPRGKAIAQVPAKMQGATADARNVPPQIPSAVVVPDRPVSTPLELKSGPNHVNPSKRSESHLELNASAPKATEPIQQLPRNTLGEQDASAPQADRDQNQQNPFSAKEQQRLAALSQAQQVHAEADDWNFLDRASEEAVGRFLARYPDGGHAPAARELLHGFSNQEQARKLNLADDTAWKSVASADRHSLEQYVSEFPSGRHTDQARQWLSEMSSAGSSREANAVIATLQKYSDAWNAKDLADITAIRPGLGRRTAKEELSSVRSIVMRIHPTSVPNIQGDHATVECIHQVDQVFNDGIEKRSPGVRMTYVLIKRGGSWLITESR